jgi:ubiquinone biosynthesis monooxygenase Coq7
MMQNIDSVIVAIDRALRVITGAAVASRPNPAIDVPDASLDHAERRHSAGLMRVNHVGEVCAQALYDAQAKFATTDAIKRQFVQAAQEEEDHLAWTAERLKELGSRPSLLNPFWYAGSYLLGTAAAKVGDAHSLGFVVETERQVEAHLAKHLTSLPNQDEKSKAIVAQMRIDEVEHGAAAHEMGAAELPKPVQKVMQAAAKIMTTTAYYL